MRELSLVSGAVAKGTTSHNIKGLRRDLSVVRSDALVKLLGFERLDPEARILSVGPRTEGELYNLAAHGFRLENIRGVDLLSYSPLIDLGICTTCRIRTRHSTRWWRAGCLPTATTSRAPSANWCACARRAE